MKCNYIEYHRLTDQMFSGVAQTDTHLNQYTEILRQYLINGGAANTMLKLGIGIQVTTKRFMLLPKEVVMRRFIWLKRKEQQQNSYRTLKPLLWRRSGQSGK